MGVYHHGVFEQSNSVSLLLCLVEQFEGIVIIIRYKNMEGFRMLAPYVLIWAEVFVVKNNNVNMTH